MTDPRLQTKTGDLVCPACGNTVASNVKLIGQRFACQKCGGNFLAPQTNPATALIIVGFLGLCGILFLIAIYLLIKSLFFLP